MEAAAAPKRVSWLKSLPWLRIAALAFVAYLLSEAYDGQVETKRQARIAEDQAYADLAKIHDLEDRVRHLEEKLGQ